MPRIALLSTNVRRLIVSLAGMLMAVATSVSAASATRPPNVIVIFCDDLGYGDVGVFGAKGFTTPNLDGMARAGVKFTNFHVAQAVCSASRTALLTGCYPNRVGIHGALGPQSTHGIHTDETTLAEVFKSRGYATGMAGKWHLGHHAPFQPAPPRLRRGLRHPLLQRYVAAPSGG